MAFCGLSRRLKARALFVLAQSNSPRARQVLTAAAKGASNPDVQRRAIQYLGVHGSQENRAILADVYTSTSDVDVKRAILRSFMVSGDRTRLVTAANTEKVPELRQEAVRQLGAMGAREELWQMYQKESTVEVKRQILQALFVAGEAQRLIEVANSEQNPELRRRAVQHLGTMGRTKTGDALVGIYAKEKDVDIKRAKDALKNDPFMLHHKAWQKAITEMLSMGVRVEQQALAKHGLNYVIERYLPEKLAAPEKFLP